MFVPCAVELDLAGAAPSADVSDLAAVLAGTVTEDGRFERGALAQVGDRLNAQLRAMAVAGPTATPELYPTYGSQWAYWYNARAAWSLKLAATAERRRWWSPQTCRRRFRLDGRWMSLEAVDRVLLGEARRAGLFRLAACAPGASVSSAPMPLAPWSGTDFPRRLEAAFDRLVLDHHRFVVDVESQEVAIPPMLWACRDMVMRQYADDCGKVDAALLTALRPRVGAAARRRLEEAVGYEAVPQRRSSELAVPRGKVYFPGRIGRVEPVAK